MNTEKGPRPKIHLLGAGHLTCINSPPSFPAWRLNHVTPNILISEDVPAHIIKKSSLSSRLLCNFTSKKSRVAVCLHRVRSGCSSLLPGELEFRDTWLRPVDNRITTPSPLLSRNRWPHAAGPHCCYPAHTRTRRLSQHSLAGVLTGFPVSCPLLAATSENTILSGSAWTQILLITTQV